MNVDPTPYSLICVGTSQDATLLKALPTRLCGVHVTNNSAVPVYLKLYDTASTPTSSMTPVKRIEIPSNAALATAGAGTNLQGLLSKFRTGLGFRITTEMADNGTTGVAATSVIVNIDYE